MSFTAVSRPPDKTCVPPINQIPRLSKKIREQAFTGDNATKALDHEGL